MATWADVRKIVAGLPATSEARSASGGLRWNVGQRGLVWERPLRPADLAALGKRAPAGAILGLRTADLGMKEVLLTSDPRVFFTTPHFDGYPALLIRLRAISKATLRAAIVDTWLALAPKRAVRAYQDDAGAHRSQAPARRARANKR